MPPKEKKRKTKSRMKVPVPPLSPSCPDRAYEAVISTVKVDPAVDTEQQHSWSPTPPPGDADTDTDTHDNLQQAEDLPSMMRLKKRRKNWQDENQPLRLSTLKEEDLRDWLHSPERQHLYDKSHEKYLDRHLKERAWMDKATELNLTADRLLHWFKNIRDTYARAKKDMEGKSGSGLIVMKGRKKWIYDNFHFLGVYLHPQLCRRGPGLYASKLGLRPTASATLVLEDDQDSDDVMSQQVDYHPDTDSDAPSQRAPGVGVRARATRRMHRPDSPSATPSHETRTALHDLIRQTTRQAEILGQTVTDAVGPTRTVPEAYGQFLASVPPSLHHSVQPAFYREVLDLVLQYQAFSDAAIAHAARSQSTP